MNYHKIHDLLISRARSRKYDSKVHHNHHIIPRHEDPTSKEVVPVTIKEHYVIHLLRFKMGYGVGNLKAYLFIRGLPNDIWNITSEAGKVGGRTTRINGSGIFSPNWDRSRQSKKNWELGLLSHVDFSELGATGGENTKKNKSGIFNPSLQYKRKEWAGMGSNALIESGNYGGVVTSEWRDHHKEEMKQYCISGGKVGGSITGKMLWWNNGVINTKSNACPGTGWKRGMLMSVKKRKQVYSDFAGHNRRKSI